MKKMFIMFLIAAFFCAPVFCDELSPENSTNTTVETTTVYDIYQHEDIAANVLMGWGGLSLGTGLVMYSNGNEFAKGFGLTNLIWGAVDTAIGVWIKKDLDFRKANISPEKELQMYKDNVWLNFVIDGVCILAGSGMLVWGNDSVKGFGAGVLTQGIFLITYDGVNFMIADNLSKRYPDTNIPQ